MNVDIKTAALNSQPTESPQLRTKITQETKHQEIGCKTAIQLACMGPIVPQEKKKEKWIQSRSPERTNGEPNFIKIGNNSLADAISNSDSEKVLSSDTKSNLWRKLVQYLKSIDKDNQATYSPDDEIVVRKDEAGPYLIFLRDKKSSPKIRP